MPLQSKIIGYSDDFRLVMRRDQNSNFKEFFLEYKSTDSLGDICWIFSHRVDTAVNTGPNGAALGTILKILTEKLV